MKKLFKILYSRYCLAVFVLIFLLLTPLYMLFIHVPGWRKYALKLNHWWAVIFFKVSMIPVKEAYRQELNQSGVYIFCANHTSFLDIPLLGLITVPFVFVGKSSISKVPLFGYVYKKIHITLDRTRLKSRYQTLEKASKVIDQGTSLVMFPEGGSGKEPPRLSPFKDGPFRIAIEKQIPLVPVTIPYNWIILPNRANLMVTRRTAAIIYHPPVSTDGLTLNDLDRLKEQVYRQIESEMPNSSEHGNK